MHSKRSLVQGKGGHLFFACVIVWFQEGKKALSGRFSSAIRECTQNCPVYTNVISCYKNYTKWVRSFRRGDLRDRALENTPLYGGKYDILFLDVLSFDIRRQESTFGVISSATNTRMYPKPVLFIRKHTNTTRNGYALSRGSEQRQRALQSTPLYGRVVIVLFLHVFLVWFQGLKKHFWCDISHA